MSKVDPELREVSLDIAKSEQRHQHEVESHRENNKWDSCCFTLNKEAVLFFSHYVTLIAILITAIIGVFSNLKV